MNQQTPFFILFLMLLIACVGEDSQDIELPEIRENQFQSQGGNNLTPQFCLQEEFTNYPRNADNIPAYEHALLKGDRFWKVGQHDFNQFIQMSAFEGSGEYDSWFIMPVDFNQAKSLLFETKAGFYSGDVLSVLYTTNHVPGEVLNPDNWTDITDEFTISSGETSGFPENFTKSGAYSFPDINENGYVAFRYEGSSEAATTVIQIDNIKITSVSAQNCSVVELSNCNEESFSIFQDDETELDSYQNFSNNDGNTWQVKRDNTNRLLEFRANDSPQEEDAWFVLAMDLNSVEAISFQTRDGLNNGEALQVLYTTDYGENGFVTPSEWEDITDEFFISSGTTATIADEFTFSGLYQFDEPSEETGYIAFRYLANEDVTTTIQIDDIVLYGDGECKKDLPSLSDDTGPDIIGGSNASFLSCLDEDFSSYSGEQFTFDKYYNVALDAPFYWNIRRTVGIQVISALSFPPFSAYDPPSVFKEYDSWLLIPVNFDEADELSFQVRFVVYTSDALSVLYSTQYVIGDEFSEDDWVDITDEFNIPQFENFQYTNSGAFSLSNISGNGYIALRVQDQDPTTSINDNTAIDIDNLKIVDFENTNCTD